MVCSPNQINKEQNMNEVELTVDQKMEIAIAKAKEARKKTKDEAKLKLLDNQDYVGFLAKISEESDDIKLLQSKLELLNKIKAIVAEDGTEYRVHVYPVAEYLFGPVMSRVMAIIVASSSMFTDERQTEFEVITGIKYLSAIKAKDAIGNPAYYSKGNLVEAIPGNGENINSIMTSILVDLDIDVEYVSKIDKIDAWFEASLKRAQKKFDEFSKAQKNIKESEEFKLED